MLMKTGKVLAGRNKKLAEFEKKNSNPKKKMSAKFYSVILLRQSRIRLIDQKQNAQIFITVRTRKLLNRKTT